MCPIASGKIWIQASVRKPAGIQHIRFLSAQSTFLKSSNDGFCRNIAELLRFQFAKSATVDTPFTKHRPGAGSINN